MKALIVTINEKNTNYGNRLQNYAVQKILQEQGLRGESLCFEKKKNYCLVSWVKYVVNRLTNYRLAKNSEYWKTSIPKTLNFEKFNRRYMNMRYERDFRKLDNYDYYILGSDQVWNPAWYDTDVLKKEAYFLTFAEDSKKICLAPSFGVSALPEEWQMYFAKEISKFRKISVREKEGADIIKNLIGREATVLIDPTMMLGRKEWRKIMRAPKGVLKNKKYILTYFLGARDQAVMDKITKIAENNNLQIYHLMDKAQRDIFASGPREFVYLIDHADLVVTDSFHGGVFSFLFNRPFLMCARKGKEVEMMSRINTFLKTFHLERKYIESGIGNDLFEKDYEKGYRQLQLERKRFMQFLKISLSDGNGKE